MFLYDNGSVLIVDDDADCRTVLTILLESHGLSVISAGDCAEAIELAVTHLPRVILMDLSMPGIDGYETTCAIRADARTKNIPIVALSAHCDDPINRRELFRWLHRLPE